MKKHWPAVSLSVLLFLFGFVYRYYGLKANTPFWVDEFATADQAKLFVKYGFSLFTSHSFYVEHHNLTTHLLTALSFKIFGMQEWAARLPFAIIGAGVGVLLYHLGKRLFGKTTGFLATILYATSYFSITWARQARGYVLLQACIIATLILVEQVAKNKKSRKLDSVLLALTVIVGIITHSMYYLFLAVLALVYLKTNKDSVKLITRPLFILTLILVIVLSALLKVPTALLAFTSGELWANNLWYYHSFLWREYGLITFLAIIGWVMAFRLKSTTIKTIILYSVAHLLFLFFLFAPYVSRYLLPIMPFLYMGMAYAIVRIAGMISGYGGDGFAKTVRNATAFLIVLLIVANGNLFTIKPKRFYSVNHIFREIALIDYNQVYDIVKNAAAKNNEKPAVIDTWPARANWYLGRDYGNTYMVKWNDNGKTNGISRTTEFYINSNGEKILKGSNEKLILDIGDLKKITGKYKHGFMFIDDATLPKDIIDYAEKNMKKEIYLDHYTLDDNPYSIWPATLYSW